MSDFNFIIEMPNVHVASISGGRTSHYEIHALIEKFGRESLHLVYCDTGAEHDGTYKFIRDTERFFGIKINCIRLVLPKDDGVGCQYEVVDINDLKRDYKAFIELMEKYGRPFNPGGKFCTDQMKTQIYRKYCNDVFGKGMYTTWIGYRDESKDASRSWGHKLSIMLSKWFGIDKIDQGEFYKECRSALDISLGKLFDVIGSHAADEIEEKYYKRICQLADRVVKNKQLGYRFLFEISDFDEADIKTGGKNRR